MQREVTFAGFGGQGIMTAGKLLALAVTTARRSTAMPDVPTVAETGPALANFDINTWFGLFGPAKMPKEIVDRLSREMAVVLAKPEVREAFGRLAFEPRSSTPEALSAFVAEQLEAYRRVTQAVGLSLD